jgi:hypothetical protein
LHVAGDLNAFSVCSLLSWCYAFSP